LSSILEAKSNELFVIYVIFSIHSLNKKYCYLQSLWSSGCPKEKPTGLRFENCNNWTNVYQQRNVNKANEVCYILTCNKYFFKRSLGDDVMEENGANDAVLDITY
jgi:hypothetical protein